MASTILLTNLRVPRSSSAFFRRLGPSTRCYAVPTNGAPVTATNRAEATLKRFWKTVGIDKRPEGYAVTLDRRPLKTPSGNTLIVPHEKRLVASLIANEWENQETVLRPHALPMTSIASRAIDTLSEKQSRKEVHAALVKYLDSDTVCFHQDGPEALVNLQNEHWKPLLSWIEGKFDVEIRISESIFVAAQLEETRKRFEKVLEEFDGWQLAAMERATYTTKSFLIALALLHGRLDVQQAALAAHVEVNSQIEKWGEVEDSHDVDYQDIRRQLGSVACLIS